MTKPLTRCSWAGDDPLYIRYHDEEWGVPIHDDRELFEYSAGTLSRFPGEMLVSTNDLYGTGRQDPDMSIQTKYESGFRKEGKQICYLCFRSGESDRALIMGN